MASRWSMLVGDLLEDIEAELVLYGDKVRIRAVCNYWNSRLEKLPSSELPLLFQALDQNASHGFFNLSDKKFYYLDLPEVAKSKIFVGFSQGWLCTMQYVDPNPENYEIAMHLINPFTNAVIQLPPRIKFPDVVEYCPDRVDDDDDLVGSKYKVVYENRYNGVACGQSLFTDQLYLIYAMGKVIFTAPPCCDDYIVVAIYGNANRLAFWTPKSVAWMPIEVKFTSMRASNGIFDMLLHNGKLYTLNSAKGLAYFDEITSNPKMMEVISEGPIGDVAYLAEDSDGKLLMIVRDIDYNNSPSNTVTTLGFEVYRIDDDSSSWVQVDDIGGDILFVGCYGTSVSKPSRDFPEFRGNCIYFTDSRYSYIGKEQRQEDSDIGVFDMKDGSIDRLSGFACNPRFIWPPPIWVSRSIC